MAAFSNYLQNKVLDAELRGTPYTFPTTVYVGLVTTLENAAAGGVEVSGNGYARAAEVSNLTDWSGTQGAGTTAVSSGTSGTISNNVAINFPTPTGSGWGTVVGFGLWDASTGGNLLIFAPLAAPQTIGAGNTVSFPAGTLTDSIA